MHLSKDIPNLNDQMQEDLDKGRSLVLYVSASGKIMGFHSEEKK